MDAHESSQRFSEAQLKHILEQSMMYSCGCPEELSEILLQLRNVRAQMDDCLADATTDAAAHQRVLDMLSVVTPHVEACLADILESEDWDMDTFSLPASRQERFLDESNC